MVPLIFEVRRTIQGRLPDRVPMHGGPIQRTLVQWSSERFFCVKRTSQIYDPYGAEESARMYNDLICEEVPNINVLIVKILPAKKALNRDFKCLCGFANRVAFCPQAVFISVEDNVSVLSTCLAFEILFPFNSDNELPYFRGY